MSFWRKEVIDFALDRETQSAIEEQRAWILREPTNPKPYYHLAQLYRVAFKPEEALGLLLEAVRLESNFAEAEMLYIDPVECIDCGACVPVCPVSAIFAQDDLPDKWAGFTQKNAAYFGR